ncbi:unnamed protein product [Leuciscus chuanchicus]
MAAWRCMICFVFVALSLKVLLSHINASHSRSPDFWVYCGIDGCEQGFRVFNSFFRHIKRTHLQYFKTGCPPSGWSTTPSSRSLGQETFGVSVFASCSTHAAASSVAIPPDASLPEPSPQRDAVARLESEEAVAVTSRTRPDIARSAAAFAISVREQCHLSQRTVNSVISGVQQYQAALLDTLRERIRRVFEDNPETTAQLQDEALATFDTFMDPFSTTAYGQNKTIRELFNPVNPEEVVVSQTILKWYILNGNKYISGKSMIIVDVDGAFPVFGLIKDIFVIDSSYVAFEYRRYETLNLSPELLAYELILVGFAFQTRLIKSSVERPFLGAGLSPASATFVGRALLPGRRLLRRVLPRVCCTLNCRQQ